MEINILSTPFTAKNEKEILKFIEEKTHSENSIHIVTPNPEIMLAAEGNQGLKVILSKTFNVPDGNGIIWAHKFLEKTKKLPNFLKLLLFLPSLIFYPFSKSSQKHFSKPITGTDLMFKVCTEKEIFKKTPIFLLGAKPGIALKAAHKLKKINNELNIVGCSYKNPGDPSVIDDINNSGAKILFVAFGSPKQEFWIHKNLPRLKNVKCAIGVGGAFDFHSGEIKRAPFFLRKIGLEWIYRLVKDPRRIRRIFNAVVLFPIAVLKFSLTKKHS